MNDRRGAFFLAAAALAFALAPVADPKQRWVPLTVGAVYVVLSLLAWLDGLSRSRLGRRQGDARPDERRGAGAG